ncbi:MAG TPA: hypothetical protein VFK86_21405 [Bauldia sp.]|nr:hypothetical protein [Bauldia sp.]
MAHRDDILVETTSPVIESNHPLRVRVAAFVPITVAILGIGAVLLGGVSARHEVAAVTPMVDAIATGSIAKD